VSDIVQRLPLVSALRRYSDCKRMVTARGRLLAKLDFPEYEGGSRRGFVRDR